MCSLKCIYEEHKIENKQVGTNVVAQWVVSPYWRTDVSPAPIYSQLMQLGKQQKIAQALSTLQLAWDL